MDKEIESIKNQKSLIKQEITYYFFDYETWGKSPKRDRPAQFAGLRTNKNLELISNPDNWLCKLTPDYLPSPTAALITGLTPQKCDKGLCEKEFMKNIQNSLSKPGTCRVGYNNIGFDDEFTRYGLYRNYLDPYSHERANGNMSCGDLLAVVRAFYVISPNGIRWPLNQEGCPSFKLADMAKENGINEGTAHDALTDVRTTLKLAKLLREKNGTLFNELIPVRQKDILRLLIKTNTPTPLVYIAPEIPANQGFASWILPLCYKSHKEDELIAFNLTADLKPLLQEQPEALREMLFKKNADMAPGEKRPGIHFIKLKKNPLLFPAKTLTPERAKNLGVDRERCLSCLEELKPVFDKIKEKAKEIFAINKAWAKDDSPDYQLYDGFIGDKDRELMKQLDAISPKQLGENPPSFSDDRLKSMLLRFRARNYPESLNAEDKEKWLIHCRKRLNDGFEDPPLTWTTFFEELENCKKEHKNDERSKKILEELTEYAFSLKNEIMG